MPVNVNAKAMVCDRWLTPSRRVRAEWRVAVGTVLALALTTPLAAQERYAPELRYALVPTASRVFWDNDLGLEDTYLYGARLGFTFGNYVGLQGYYLTGNEFDTRFRDTPLRWPDGSLLPERRVNARSYGADMLFNVGSSGLLPFVKVGAGVMRFEPDSGRRSDQIAVKYGGGLRLVLRGGLRLQAFAEDQLFRINRYRLAAGDPGDPLPEDVDADKLQHNLIVGAGITIPFGHSADVPDTPEYGLSRVGLPVEVIAGRVQFDGSTNLERQSFIGARTGIDFGRLVGLRAYYWRGTTDSFDRAQPIQSWGGEAQFNLSPASGIAPYLIAGAGELDFHSGYRNRAGDPMEDRTMLIVGGGLRFGITDRVRLDVAARDYVLAEATDIQDVSSTKQLKSNWAYTAGLSFTLFGPRNGPGSPPHPPVEMGGTVQAATEPGAVALRDTVRMLRDSLTRARLTAQADAARPDSLVDVRRQPEVRAPATGAPPSSTTYVSARSVAVPVPQEGEIYVRYGPPEEGPPVRGMRDPLFAEAYDAPLGASGPAALRAAIRDVVRDELERDRTRPDSLSPTDTASALRGDPTENQIVLLERRIAEQLDRRFAEQSQAQHEMLRALISEEMARQRTDADAISAEVARAVEARLGEPQRPAAPEPTVIVRQDTVRADSANVTTVTTVTAEVESRTTPWARAFYGYSGVGTSGATQFILGARADLGSLFRNFTAVALVPELALGFGAGATTSLFAANAQLRIARLWDVAPYVSLGVGLLNHTAPIEGREGVDVVLNPGIGAQLTFPDVRNTLGLGSAGMFVEYQGIAWFDVSRLLAGLTWRF